MSTDLFQPTTHVQPHRERPPVYRVSIWRVAAGVFLGLVAFTILLAGVGLLLLGSVLSLLGGGADASAAKPAAVLAAATPAAAAPAYTVADCRKAIRKQVGAGGAHDLPPYECEDIEPATVTRFFRKEIAASETDLDAIPTSVPKGWADCGEGYHYVGGKILCKPN